MQTFLPYPSFRASLECLDNRRLGKQRVEARTILRTLENGGGWARHPAVRMWKGHTVALSLYYDLSVVIWIERGFKNSMKVTGIIPLNDDCEPVGGQRPWWLGLEPFHASHRSNLLRKDPKHYGQFGWTEPDDLPYVWPTVENRAMLKSGGTPLNVEQEI